jgi:hypothetical protein
MVQNWENFMSPTGGVVDESWQIGMASIGADLFNTFVTIPALSNRIDYLQKGMSARSHAVALRKKRLDQISARWTHGGDRWEYIKKRSNNPKFIKRVKNIKIPKHRNEINALKSTKSLTKLISKGFLFMGMASLAESIFSPNYGLSQSATRSNQQGMGPQMIDTEIAYTQRQRALMAIHDSQLGLRGVLGNESQYFHR